MSKVALITNHDDDVFCFRKELLEELYNRGNEIIISCPYGEKLDLLKFKFKHDDVGIDRRGINPLNDLKLFAHYSRFLKENKPDIVLNYTIKPNVYASMACRFKHIDYINNITGLGSVENKSAVLQSIVYRLLKFALKGSKCVFFQNKTNMELVTGKGIIKTRYRLIPGSGVNVERYKVQPYPKDDKTIVFNYVGRILSEKGVDDYIEAAKRIKEKGYDTEFNIIGFVEPTEKHYVEELRKLEKEDVIKYRGQQKDVRPFIKRAHAIIHPSKYGEGMSNVLLENASSGRPIITTNNPGCFETVDDGKTGFIFEKGDVDDLVEKIEKFIKLPYSQKKKMGLLGRKKMEKEFNREIVINEYIKEIG